MAIAAKSILVIVDVQNDFCPGGALEVPNGDRVVPIVNALSGKFAEHILTQDWHPPGHSSFASTHQGRAAFETITLSYGEQVLWPDHCVQGTPGAAFHAELRTDGASLIVRKGFRAHIDSYSAFYENDQKTPTGFTGYLRSRGFEHLYIAGLATDFCVAFSALDARREGFGVTVIEDACAAIDRQGSLAAAWDNMGLAGVQRAHSRTLLGSHAL
ncbi:MAG: bifunctional nicotinamidase/pyrazinamidase [Gammaproteobacteria bacterium]|nr:bifunctional nicotinamidase/pyrazinamidase [Gammaproteobacteria bacterium]